MSAVLMGSLAMSTEESGLDSGDSYHDWFMDVFSKIKFEKESIQILQFRKPAKILSFVAKFQDYE